MQGSCRRLASAMTLEEEDILANFGIHAEFQNPLCRVFSEHQNQIRISALTLVLSQDILMKSSSVWMGFT